VQPFQRIAVIAAVCLSSASYAADVAHDLQAYIEALHQNQYSDLAADYLRMKERDPKTPAALKSALDYEIGATLMRLAETADLETERKAFDEAGERFRKYLAAAPKGEHAIDSRNQMAYILLKRGQRALLIADAETKPERQQAQRLEARKNFDQARKDFDDALASYEKTLATRKEEAPKKGDRVKDAATQAKMNRALVEYYSAKTFDAKSADRKKALIDAEKRFAQVVYETSRDTITVASIFAKIHQAKAMMEAGDVRTAVDVLEEAVVNETLARGRASAELRGLFARARHELAVALNTANRSKDVTEGVYSAREWVEKNAAAAKTAEGLGVQLELAKAYITQAKAEPAESPRRRTMMASAVRYLNNVARVNSPYSREAFKLRGDLGGEAKTAGKAVTFEEAVESAAMFRQEEKWSEAAEAYAEALPLAASNIDPERIADVRYWIAASQLRAGALVSAVQTAKALVTEMPRSRRSPQVAGIAVGAMLQLYRQAQPADRAKLATELVAFAKLIEGQYQGLAAADDGRRARGYLGMMQQNYADAAAAFAAVTKEYRSYAECQLRLAQSQLRMMDAALRKPDSKAAAEAMKPQIAAAYAESSKAQRDELLKPGDSGEKPDPSKVVLPPLLIEAETGWTEFSLRFGDLAKAASLVDPLLAAVQTPGRTDVDANLATRVLVAALEVANTKKDFAKADQLVESVVKQGADDPAKVTPVLVRIGTNLESQLKQYRAAKNDEQANSTLELLKRFLATMKNRPKHDYRGLRYIAEANFNLGFHADAAKQYADLLESLKSNPPEVPERSRAGESAYLKMRRIAAMRMGGEFQPALDGIDALIAEVSPPGSKTGYPLSQQMERGRILLAWGAKEPAKLDEALRQWAAIQRVLTPLRRRPIEFFEVQLNIAQCLVLQNKKQDALGVLKAVIALNPDVGSPKMKLKYEDLLKTLE
jgi:hypothetical protein